MSRPVAGAIALWLAGCAGGGAPAAPPVTPCSAATAAATTAVAMVADLMIPGCIEVPRGAPVEFLNQDPEMHTATAQSGPATFDLDIPAGTSGLTPPLDGPAVIVAACTFHPAMQVTIFVR